MAKARDFAAVIKVPKQLSLSYSKESTSGCGGLDHPGEPIKEGPDLP